MQQKPGVIHSHNYNCMQQFHRNFDPGVSQAEHPEVFEGVPSEGEGIRLVKKSMAYLLKTRPHMADPPDCFCKVSPNTPDIFSENDTKSSLKK